MKNVAVEETNKQGLDNWDGWCMELVDELLHKYPQGEILWIDLPRHHRWHYHAVLVLDGIVHDAWHPNVMLPPEQYVQRVFGAGAKWELNPDRNIRK